MCNCEVAGRTNRKRLQRAYLEINQRAPPTVAYSSRPVALINQRFNEASVSWRTAAGGGGGAVVMMVTASCVRFSPPHWRTFAPVEGRRSAGSSAGRDRDRQRSSSSAV